MKLTKFGHACVRVEHRPADEETSRRLVIDPGSFTQVSEALQGAEAILITHEHPDHIAEDPVVEFLHEHPAAVLYAPAVVRDRLAQRVEEDRVITVGPDQHLEVAGLRIRTIGGQHEVIHPQIPVVANIGYLINETLYHPGDSYIVPAPAPGADARPQIHTLCLPLNAPWAALEQTLDFMISIRPNQVVPVHNGLLADNGHKIYGKQLVSFAEKYGITAQMLAEGESTWVKQM